ncbi:hypothetical protein NE237_006151 [Protea cynaroides]|uniref:Uncharacterized protein n=1 Tax=Protea cynaroides TaxID=273540 RepID=A0A9Q0KLY4_9MAGN|nr:hypothetical protein NE237_006151 [Protea cynaroides]
MIDLLKSVGVTLMAPRRALGKRPHGSSVHAPQPPAPQLDELWFRSEAAQARFPWWVPVISYTETTRPYLVKHFYANLELHGDVNDPNQGEQVSLPYLVIHTMNQATLADQASNLPYGHLITSLLRCLGVGMRGEVAAEDTMTSDIDWDAILRMQMDNLPVSDDELEARPRPLRRVAAAAAAANAAYAAEAESDDDEDRAEGVPASAPQPTPAAPPSTSIARPSHPPPDPVLSIFTEIRDTQRVILESQREMGQELGRLARSLRVTQDQVHWLRVAYERDYDIADPIPPRPPTP